MNKKVSNKSFGLSLAIVFFVGVALGGLVQVGALCWVAERASSRGFAPALVAALERSTGELERTTAERDRLLEHLAGAESSAADTDCTPVLVWSCPAREVQP